MSGKKTLKITIALSGGFDSALAAKILKDKGYAVTGLHMKVLPGQEVSPAVLKVSEKLGIDLKVIDLSQDFREKIIEPFCKAYIKGITPNPCVGCNEHIKFGRLLFEARKMGSDKLATGHYCILKKNSLQKFILLKGSDKKKDQSYFLWRLTQAQLAHASFPLGNYKKEDVKRSSLRFFPFLKGKSESQEICFVRDDYKSFLKDYLGDSVFKKGKVLDTRGRVLGYHKGIASYTIGQRRGLGISSDRPLYVSEIIPEKNIVVLASEKEIYKDVASVTGLNFIGGYKPSDSFKADVKIRYNSTGSAANIDVVDDGKAVIRFDEKQRSVTPGQSAVFYDGEILLGGGIIERNRD